MIARKGAAITAIDEKGHVLRIFECRNVASAIDLEMKLTSDPVFAAWWAREVDPTPPKLGPLER